MFDFQYLMKSFSSVYKIASIRTNTHTISNWLLYFRDKTVYWKAVLRERERGKQNIKIRAHIVKCTKRNNKHTKYIFHTYIQRYSHFYLFYSTNQYIYRTFFSIRLILYTFLFVCFFCSFFFSKFPFHILFRSYIVCWMC